ncbi:MBL fold metallo-hydrolase [Acidiphilium sp.]|uniref:MBL fold metallo-hydrolase n=1 Tax=Acidiphilium sp. TaxID=527 RepID=UPI002588ABEB|nr:MBL fold metallo-hydrolase [Acidiphilium sp.]
MTEIDLHDGPTDHSFPFMTQQSSNSAEPPPSFRVGDALVTRIPELRWTNADPARLYPDLDAAALGAYGSQLSAGSYNPDTGKLAQGTHSWLVRHAGRIILIDTATGNNKPRPSAPMLDRLDTPYLSRLAAAGVTPEQVDLVLLTHIHADHVGWNTVLQDNTWQPLFTRARHVYSETEARYAAALDGFAPAPDLPPADLGRADHPPMPQVYTDSLKPVIDAGLGQAIAIDGKEIADGLSFHPAPGHSIDHAVIRLRSRGEEAWFIADIMHHPLQAYRPDLRSVYCEFPKTAEQSRRGVLAQAAESGALCFSAHFAESGAGRITRNGPGFAWKFVNPKENSAS